MQDVTLILDLGKTHKKLLVFDRNLQLLAERQTQILETENKEGLLIDDVPAIWQWLTTEIKAIAEEKEFRIRAINVTTFGATIAHLSANGELALPVISYSADPGSEIDLAYRTWMETLPGGFARHATPPLPQFLNIGKQIFYLRRHKPKWVEKISHSLFLPQYFVFQLTGKKITEPTGYGCHTGLWDFEKMTPSKAALSGLDWRQRMPGLARPHKDVYPVKPDVASELGLAPSTLVGTGLHDSSSALVPYLTTLKKNFALVSTGTWIISLNPDAEFQLADEDLQRDRLYYLTPQAHPVRAARLFAGREHDLQLERIEKHFGRPPQLDETNLLNLIPRFFAESSPRCLRPQALSGSGPFPDYPAGEWDLSQFNSAEEAYARLCLDLAVLTDYCLSEICSEKTNQIILDGGFAKNRCFVQLLAMLEQPLPVSIARLPRATAMGAALFVHQHWAKDWQTEKSWVALQPVKTKPFAGLRVYAEHLLAEMEKMDNLERA